MKSYIERKDESMANEKLKFTSLEEAKEFLLKSKEENADVSQKQFLDAVSALNLDDDTMDDLYNWIDENLIEFIDGEELDEDEVLDDDLSDEDLDEEDSIAEEISQLEKTFANASHAKINVFKRNWSNSFVGSKRRAHHCSSDPRRGRSQRSDEKP